MKEIIDIRAHEDWAKEHFGGTLGQPFSAVRPTGDPALDAELQRRFPPRVRRILIDVSDPRFTQLAHALARTEQDAPEVGAYSYASVSREYTRKELANAERYRLLLTRMFEPCGEDMGTEYDDTNACPKCGYGRVQRSPLRLNLRKVPKRVDLAFTIARNEWIVSERLASLMTRRRVAPEDQLTGFRLEPVEHKGRKAPEQSWHQLIVTGCAGHTVAPSRFAIDYICDDPDGRFVCENHALSGLNLVSEVYLDRNSLEPVDLAVTTDRDGLRSGVLMPTPVLVISKRFYRLLRDNRIKGFKVEVAHLVD